MAFPPSSGFSRPPTLKDVASAADVALATASYALSGRKRGGQISPAVVARVKHVARRLGYTANRTARSLASGRASAVGLVVSSQTPYSHASWGQFIDGIEAELAGHTCSILIREAHNIADSAGIAFDLLRSRLTDAVVLPCRDLKGPWPVIPHGVAAPVLVPLGGSQPDFPYPTVTIRIPDGLREAVRELAALGHRRFLWLEPENAQPERRESVAAEIDLLGLKLDHAAIAARVVDVFEAPASPQRKVQAAVDAALSHPFRATAILCWNDRLAYHAQATLVSRGIRVPEQVSLVGFDDFIAAWTVPALSTVSLRNADRAAYAVRLAFQLLECPSQNAPDGQPAKNVELPSRFIARDTTGPACSGSDL